MAKEYKNLDESLKNNVIKNLEVLDGMVLDESEALELVNSIQDEAPLDESLIPMYLKMANTQQKYLDENLNTTGDIAGYEKMIQPLLRRMVTQLNAPRLCSVQSVSVPDSSVFALKPKYSGYKSTESGNPLIVVHGTSAGGATAIKAGDTVNGNGGATGTVLYAEDDGKGNSKALVEVTAAGNGFIEGDNLIGDVTLTASFSNEMFFKQVLPGYTGAFATNVGERLGGNQPFSGGAAPDKHGQEFPEMSLTIEKLPISVETRKLKARVTIELLQDLNKLFGLDGKKEINRFMAAEIALEIDFSIIEKYKTIARVRPEFVPTVQTDSQGRWSEEMYKGVAQKINREALGIAESSRRGAANILVGTAGTITALRESGELNTNVAGTNSFYIGKTKSGLDVYHDFYYAGKKDYALLIRKGQSNFDSPLIYSPYISLIPLQATDAETLQPVLGMMSRYGLTTNTLSEQPSDSVIYFDIDLKDTPLKRA